MGLPDPRRNKKNSSPSWQPFPASPPFPLLPLVLRESVCLCPRALALPRPISVSPSRAPRRGASREISGSSPPPRALLFVASLRNPPPFVYHPLGAAILRSFVSRFSSVRRRRSILSGRSSLDHWPGRKLDRVRNPLATPR